MDEQNLSPRNGTRAKALCALAVLAVLAATLWPFNPFPRNGAHWIQGATGLKFEKSGLVVSDQPLEPPETHASESYSLELLLTPTSVRSSYTILGFYVPTRPRQLLVRQWTDGLLVTHDASVDRDRTRTIKFDVDHVFHRGKLVLVTLSFGPNGTTVYVDGQPAGSAPRFKISRSEIAGEIVLGTSPVTYAPWPGELHGLAIYSKELTAADALQHYKEWVAPSGHPDLDGALARYTFAEAAGRDVRNELASAPNLEIPTTFSVPHKGMLLSPAREFEVAWRYAVDVVINIAGFVPLGMIIYACFVWTRGHWQAILLTTVSCGTLSFMIEVLQYYIPKRGSGVTDIITNTLGGILGALIARSGVMQVILERMKLIPINRNRGHSS